MDYRTPPNSQSLPCRPAAEIWDIVNAATPARLVDFILGARDINADDEQRERYVFREIARLRVRQLRDAGQL